MADDVVGGHSACLVVAGPPQSGKRFSLVGNLGEFVGMGLAPRLAADILDRAEQARADGPLSCNVGVYQVLRAAQSILHRLPRFATCVFVACSLLLAALSCCPLTGGDLSPLALGAGSRACPRPAISSARAPCAYRRALAQQ